MKLCKYCNVEKKLDFFPLRKSSKDGRRNKCKQCASLDRRCNKTKPLYQFTTIV